MDERHIVEALCNMAYSVDQLTQTILVATPSHRERIATAVLAGMCADPERNGSHSAFIVDAITFADALIAELDEDNSADA